MTTLTTNPALFITDYASYNAGLQFVCGKWYDLTEFNSVDELIEAIQDQYNEVLNDPENKEMKELYIKYNIDFNNISNLELMITDFEGFPREMYSENFDTGLIEKIIENIDIIQEFENISDSNLVNYHNQYCDNNNYNDDYIYDFDEEFFNLFFEGKPMEASRATHFGNVNWNDDFIQFNCYGNLESITCASDQIDKDVILKDIIENRQNYSI